MSTLSTTNLKNPSSGSNNIVLNADGTTTVTAPSNIIKSGTAVASTSGVAIDFTGIPSWVKRVTVMFNGVSTSGSSLQLVQIGNTTFQTTGYSSVGMGSVHATVNAVTNSTAGFVLYNDTASDTKSGILTLNLISSNTYVCFHNLSGITGRVINFSGSGVSPALSSPLDRIRITTVNGTDTFDAGSINILWEG